MNQAGPSTHPGGEILKALLRSTLLKDLIRIRMNAAHPESGRTMVKTLLGDDPEVFFGIAGGLPAMVNSALGALTELAVQLKDKYPPDLLKTFLLSLLEDIDRDAAKECGRAWAGLAKSVLQASPDLKARAVGILLDRGPGIKAGAINAFSRFMNEITRDDPQAFCRFLSEVFEKVDNRELGRAAAAIANALLDQKWHLASWGFDLVKGRIKRRFGKQNV
jgi:hypothetical protein